MGEEGLKEVAGLCLKNSHHLKRGIEHLPGYSSPFSAPFFKEFVVKAPLSSQKINQRLLEAKILGGLDPGRFYPELENYLLFCTTEKRTREEMDKLVSLLGEVE